GMPDNDRMPPRRPGNDGGPGPLAPRTRLTPWILIALVVLALVAFNQWFSSASKQQISYSQFQQYVTDGKISAVPISDNAIPGTYKDDQNQDVAFTTTLSNSLQLTPESLQVLSDHHVDVKMSTPSPWFSLLASILPLVLLMGVAYYFLFR